jgi:hypothetical protein
MKRVFPIVLGLSLLALFVIGFGCAAPANSGTPESTAAAPPTPSPTVAPAPAGPRIVYGVIRRDGQVISGSGFSVLHPSDGTYVISFSPGFSSVPALSVQHIWSMDSNNAPDNSIYDTASVNYVTKNGARIRTGFMNGPSQTVNSRDFSFVAVGQ